MTHRPIQALAVLAILTLATSACGDDTDYTVAREYWAQPDSVVIGIGRPGDVKATSRDEMWIADMISETILRLAPLEGRYQRIGMGDREPVEVELPAKLAVERDVGLAVFDARRLMVDLYTLEGEYIRGFEPGFVPAEMAISREPLGFTFAVAAADSAALAEAATPEDSAAVVRRPVIIRTDLQGRDRDTLLSPTVGPEPLRTAVAAPGMTSISPSRTGVWIWSRTEPRTAFHLSARGTRRLPLRPEAETAVGIMVDAVRDMLWVIHPDSTGMTYAAYDARLATSYGESAGTADAERVVDEGGEAADGQTAETAPAGDGEDAGALAFLGVRTTPTGFMPGVIHDGVVMGIRREGGALLATSYGLNADRFERPEAPAD